MPFVYKPTQEEINGEIYLYEMRPMTWFSRKYILKYKNHTTFLLSLRLIY